MSSDVVWWTHPRANQFQATRNVGPQQNAVVDDQLAAAQDIGVSAAHQQAVSDLADEITEARDDDQ